MPASDVDHATHPPSPMNLVRLLLLLAAIWVVWRLLRGNSILPTLGRRPEAPKPPENFEPMSRCEHCGTYLPSKALSSSGRCGRCNE